LPFWFLASEALRRRALLAAALALVFTGAGSIALDPWVGL
jgi:hypothetical protein